MNWLRRLHYAVRRRRHRDELTEELQFHRDLKRLELEARGVAPSDAHDASRRALGNDALVMDQVRDVWIWPWLQDISHDLRFAIRMLAKDRRFTIAAVVALGLGIGVNNSVFAIVNATLLRDVPFEEGHRLLRVRTIDARGQEAGFSWPDLRDFQESTKAFSGLAADTGALMNVSGEGLLPDRVHGAYVSANSFRLLRVTPILGRDFMPDDDRGGAASVALISHGVWIDRYGSDPGIVGRSIKVNDTPTTIVGVMPPDFSFPFIARMWQPLSQAPAMAAAEPGRAQRNLSVTGRLLDSATRQQAQSDVEAIALRLAQDYPATNQGTRFAVSELKEDVERNSRPMLMTMMGAVSFVLLVACANLANLLLARSAARSREIAIRASLGATRWRIVRQLLIECSLLAACGGALGLALSYYGVREIAIAFNVMEPGAAFANSTRPYWLDISMGGYPYVFVGALCLFTTLAFGLIPALHVSKTNTHDTLKEGGRTIGGVRVRRWTSTLMVAELALTLILLTGSGLLWRSFIDQYRADPVLDPNGVVTLELSLPVQKYATPVQRRQFMQRLQERLAAISSVSSIAVANHSPVRIGVPRQVVIDGHPPADANGPIATTTYVTPTFFETLGFLPVRGRALTSADDRPGQEAAVVNQRFAAMFFPNEEPLGRRIQLSSPTPPSTSPWLTVVGVVPTLPRRFEGPGQKQLPDPAVYLPFSLDPAPRVASIIVRAGSGGVAAVAPALREEVRALDADLPLYNVARLEDALAQSRLGVRLIGTWFGVLAVIALVVASVGLFALTAHAVAQRAQEIGVRIALGAGASQVVGMFLRRTADQLGLGLLLGLAGALSVGQLLQGYLRDVSPRDPLTIALVMLLLITVAILATLLPARRAARIDPAAALRAE